MNLDSSNSGSQSKTLTSSPSRSLTKSSNTSNSVSLHPSASFAGSTSLLSQQILTEQEYSDSLDFIIKRDFFPTLARQKLESDYLTALNDGDESRIRQSLHFLVREEERIGMVGMTPVRSTSGDRNGNDNGGSGNSSVRQTQSNKRRRVDYWNSINQTPGETPLRSQVSNWEQTPMTISNSPNQSDLNSDSNPSTSNQSNQIDLNLSLSQFQSRYTSEDNASFNSLMARNHLKNKEKHKWVFDAERKANEKRLEFSMKMKDESDKGRALMEEEKVRRLLEIEDRKLIGNGNGFQKKIQDQNQDQNEKEGIENDKGKKKASEIDQQAQGNNNLDSNLESKTVTNANATSSSSSSSSSQNQLQSKEEDNRPSIFQPNKFKALNNLFFPPDSNISTTISRTSSLPLHSSDFSSTSTSNYLLLGEENRLEAPKPEIEIGNIRLPEGWNDESGKIDDDEDDGGGSSPSSSRIDRAIAGNASTSSRSRSGSISKSSNFSNLINSSKPSINLSTPRINGYSFVSPLPTPRPGDLGEDRIRQLMTWGQIVGTPRRVDVDDDDDDDGGHDKRKPYDDYDDDDDDGKNETNRDYFIQKTPKRDELARNLSNPTFFSQHKSKTLEKSTSKSKSHIGDNSTTPYGSQSYKTSINSIPYPYPSSPREQIIQNLSPAAKNLFDKSRKKSGIGGSGLGFGSGFGGNGSKKISLGDSLMRSRNEKKSTRKLKDKERKKEKETEMEMEIEMERRKLDLSRKGWSPSPSPRPH